MNGYEVYKLHLRIKLHYRNYSFDAFTTNVGRKPYASYTQRNDMGLYEKLGKRFKTPFECIEYFVSNISYGNDSVLYTGSVGDDYWKSWLKYKESLSQSFQNDLDVITLHCEKNRKEIKSLFDFEKGGIPEVFKLLLGRKVAVQSLVILNSYRPFFDNWKSSDIIFEDDAKRVVKTNGFVKFPSAKLGKSFDIFRRDLSELNIMGM